MLWPKLQSSQDWSVVLVREIQFHGMYMGNTSASIRVLVADSHQLFREGLRLLLELDANICVVGETGDGEEAMELARTLEPDVLLLDPNISPRSGIEILKVVQNLALPIRVLILAMEGEELQILGLLTSGASGFVMKESTGALLRKSIHAVAEGQYWIGRTNMADLIRALIKENKRTSRGSTPTKWGLTSREEQIVAEIICGSTNKQIAQTLDLSEQTVKHHLTNIFDKVGASNRLELALMVRHFSVSEQDSYVTGQEDPSTLNSLPKQVENIDPPTEATSNPLIPRSSKASGKGQMVNPSRIA
jgi:DNA-binding NarL/FixJ family response regulator